MRLITIQIILSSAFQWVIFSKTSCYNSIYLGMYTCKTKQQKINRKPMKQNFFNGTCSGSLFYLICIQKSNDKLWQAKNLNWNKF